MASPIVAGNWVRPAYGVLLAKCNRLSELGALRVSVECAILVSFQNDT